MLKSCSKLVAYAVAQRLLKLSTSDIRGLTPEELVRGGFCDPVRLFVKQEPHPMSKVETGRLRLISSVSLIDQIVERMMFGIQNSLEIDNWKSCPSKPGMGLSLVEQGKVVWDEVRFKHTLCPAAEADISGFDWSVQEWELMADVEMRVRLGNFGPQLETAARNRFFCLSNSVFQLSDGTMISQGLPGLMKSGSYCTSSSNSRIRVLMAELIGSPWCIAMGDDSVEGFVPEAREKYAALGHNCKDYVACSTESNGELESFNFCSHRFSRRAIWLESWAKSLFRFLDNPKRDFDDLLFELETNPYWPRVVRYLRRVGMYPIKQNGQRKEKFQESSGSDREEAGDTGGNSSWTPSYPESSEWF